jgi:hypothetical protein
VHVLLLPHVVSCSQVHGDSFQQLCLFSMLLLHIGSASATDSKATSIPVVAELRFLLCG